MCGHRAVSFLGDMFMSRQAMVRQAVPGTLASGNGDDSTDSQVVLGVANVYVDAVLLSKDTYLCRFDHPENHVHLRYTNQH